MHKFKIRKFRTIIHKSKTPLEKGTFILCLIEFYDRFKTDFGFRILSYSIYTAILKSLLCLFCILGRKNKALTHHIADGIKRAKRCSKLPAMPPDGARQKLITLSTLKIATKYITTASPSSLYALRNKSRNCRVTSKSPSSITTPRLYHGNQNTLMPQTKPTNPTIHN